MVLTNAQIAAILNSPTSPYPVTMRVNDNMLPPGRWTWPRMDVENITPEAMTKDIKTTDIKQVFRVHLYFRVSGNISAMIATMQQIQQIVLATFQAQNLSGTKLFKEIKDWTPFEQKLEPLRYYHATLDVEPLNVTSTSGTGTIGAFMTMTIGSVGPLQILSEETDEGNEMVRVPDDTGLTDIVGLQNVGSKYIEYEYNLTNYNAIQALIAARKYVTAQVTENSNTRTMTVLPVRQRSSVRYDGLKTTILEIQIQSG